MPAASSPTRSWLARTVAFAGPLSTSPRGSTPNPPRGCFPAHPWIKAWVGVLDHPYFAVTSDTGSYGIPSLPPGRYTIKVWHEAYATSTREVDVPAGGDISLDFIMDARRQ